MVLLVPNFYFLKLYYKIALFKSIKIEDYQYHTRFDLLLVLNVLLSQKILGYTILNVYYLYVYGQ